MEFEQHKDAIARIVRRRPDFPTAKYHGRGIVMCAGGEKYLLNAWVSLSLVRHVKCSLPIELWYLGKDEMTDKRREMFEGLGVDCIDAYSLTDRKMGGWQSKPFASTHSSFTEVLFLDADNAVTRDPEYLFSIPQYKETGAVFWPDIHEHPPESPMWWMVEQKPTDDREVESGQLLIDKSRCWTALKVTSYMNENSDFFYNYVYGDKDTFNFGWRAAKKSFAMPKYEWKFLMKSETELAAMVHFDFNGNSLFQHRIGAKWQTTNNLSLDGFQHEGICLKFVGEWKS